MYEHLQFQSGALTPKSVLNVVIIGHTQCGWLKLAMLTKFLYVKPQAWSELRLHGLKKLGFSEGGLINKSYSRPKCSCLFK